MGVFTFGYLHWRAWRLGNGIDQRLASGAVEASNIGTLEHYRQLGLLTAKSLSTTDDMQIFARLPDSSSDEHRYMAGGGEGSFVLPFSITRQDLIPPGDPTQTPGRAGLALQLQIGYEHDPNAPDVSTTRSWLPPTIAAPATAPATEPAKLPQAQVTAQILNADLNTLIAPRLINDGKPITLADPAAKTPVTVMIPPEGLGDLLKSDKIPLFYVQVTGATPGVIYSVPPSSVQLIVPAAPGHSPLILPPAADRRTDHTAVAMFQGRQGTAGQQIRGAVSNGPAAVFQFNNVDAQAGREGQVAFEVRSGIERNSDNETESDDVTHMQATVVNRGNHQQGPPVNITLESNRLAYFTVPAELTSGGNFDVVVRCLTPGHYMGLFPSSLSVIAATQSFDVNLLKSLLIMWLMALLVVTVAIFCSTFLSWPIAIVLTVVILLGRWGVEQLGDATQPGIGNLVATDMGFTDPSKAKVVSSSVEALSRGLNILASVLPDISRFASTEDIERGLVIPPARVRDSLAVLGTYGLATLTLAYVFLRKKEVAP
jgi:hypothetical protein